MQHYIHKVTAKGSGHKSPCYGNRLASRHHNVKREERQRANTHFPFSRIYVTMIFQICKDISPGCSWKQRVVLSGFELPTDLKSHDFKSTMVTTWLLLLLCGHCWSVIKTLSHSEETPFVTKMI